MTTDESSPRDQLSATEKRGAMERILSSGVLGRSEQLRQFLRYVCEAELDGRGSEISEYAVGVNALGRPSNYSPAEDSCVRSRAHELRNRLRIYYETEAPEDPIRIDLKKGGYLPQFSRAQSPKRSESTPMSELQSPELHALWQPFLESDAPILIVFDVRLFFYAPVAELVVRDYLTNDAADVGDSASLSSFRERTQSPELHERRDYADFGTVHAAFALGRLLAGSGRQIGLKHSHSLDWQDVWNSNIVFLGKANTNPIIASLLEKLPFVDNLHSIENTVPAEDEPERFHCASTHGIGEKHALITKMRSPSSGRQLLLLTGAGAELMWALGESVTDPNHARQFMPLLRDPSGDYARAFQVVLRAEFQSNVPSRIRCAAFRTLTNPD